jgi:cobalt-zinc-cadmium efflux system outer membrane protein
MLIKGNKMRKLLYIGLIIMLSMVNIPLAGAQVIQIITLDQAINQAIKYNPQLSAKRANLGVSEAQVVTANARLNPSLVTDNGVAEKTYRLGIAQTIELGGKRKKRTALAEAQRDVVVSEINTALLDLRQNVRNSYIQLYNAQQKMKAANDVLLTTGKLAEIAKKRQLAGDIAALDVLQTEITKVNAKNDLQNAKLSIAQALNSLNAFIGKPISSDSELAPPGLLSQFSETKEQSDKMINNLIEQAYNCRPELKTIIKNIEVANRQIELAKANSIPNLIFAVGPDIVLPGGEEKNNLNVNVFVTGSIDLPVFNRQQGPIKEALAQRYQAEKEFESTKNQINLNIRNAYSRIISNTETIKIYEKELLPTAQSVVEKSRRSFEEGKSNILVPITAQQSYINTKFGYVQALTDYQNAVSDLERAIGAGL